MASRNMYKLEMLLLSILSKEDCYGYQITQIMKQKSNGIVDTPASSLYPILYRLIDANCISDYEVIVGRNRKRVYYHLEEEGQKYFEKLYSEYQDVINGIQGVMDYEPPKDAEKPKKNRRKKAAKRRNTYED